MLRPGGRHFDYLSVDEVRAHVAAGVQVVELIRGERFLLNECLRHGVLPAALRCCDYSPRLEKRVWRACFSVWTCSSTARFWLIQLIMRRSSEPTCSIWCCWSMRRMALNVGRLVWFSRIHS